jgi:hypothetical protein
MKTPFLLFIAAAATLAAICVPLARAQAAQTDANQLPAGPPATLQGGPEVSRRGTEGRGRAVFGKISGLQADSIEVTGPDGEKISLKLTTSTEFRKDRQPAKMSDFKLGDSVMVRTNQNSGNASEATALMVAAAPQGGFTGRGSGQGLMQGTMGKDYVVGEVKSIDPPKLTLLRPDDITQTLELNEETSLRRGRDSITMADIQAGDHIFARGAVAKDVFVPRSLNVIPPEQWKRMQEIMMKEDGEKGRASPQSAPTPPAPVSPPAMQNPPEWRN